MSSQEAVQVSGHLCKAWLGKHPGAFCIDAITSRATCKIRFQIPIVSFLFKKIAFFDVHQHFPGELYLILLAHFLFHRTFNFAR